VQSLVGHGSPAMTAHYTHIGIKTAQNAVSVLPDVTHTTNTLPEHADATGAKFDGLLSMLDTCTDEQLAKVAAKIKKITSTRKIDRVES